MIARVRVACFVSWCAVAVVAAPVHAQTGGDAVNREIVRVTGDLYRVREGNRHTVFLVTPEGIVLGDPLSTATARWLNGELATRFPERTVRFVLHTHHHFDRAEGAGAFQSAERVAHRRFNDELAQARRAVPTFVDAIDRNENEVFDSEELAGKSSAGLLLSKDRDGDGRVSPEELYRQVLDVRRTYDDATDIVLGGRTIGLVHTGRAHAADMSVLFFESERIVFAADPPPVTEVPFMFGAWRPSEVFDWIHAVVALDFDTLVFGDGRTLSRAELTALAGYLDALAAEVADGFERGTTVAQLLSRRPASPGPHDSARDTQVGTIDRRMRLRRVLLAGSGGAAHALRSPIYCADFAACSTGGSVAAAAAALTVSSGQFGLGAELQAGAQSWHARTSPAYDEELALRETRVSALVRYDRRRPAGLVLAFVGGPSFVIGDTKGMYREKAAVAPLGGRHPLASREMRIGATGGVDVTRPLNSRLSVIVPIRVTRLLGAEDDSWPGQTTITVGAGVSMRIARQLR